MKELKKRKGGGGAEIRSGGTVTGYSRGKKGENKKKE